MKLNFASYLFWSGASRESINKLFVILWFSSFSLNSLNLNKKCFLKFLSFWGFWKICFFLFWSMKKTFFKSETINFWDTSYSSSLLLRLLSMFLIISSKDIYIILRISQYLLLFSEYIRLKIWPRPRLVIYKVLKIKSISSDSF